MRALLLSAGLGTRLRPITEHKPKCLVEINGRPLMQYWLDILCNSEVERILVNTHYLSDQVNAFITSCARPSDIEVVYEPMLLGTAGTILRNRDFFEDRPFFVAHADNLTIFNFADFKRFHMERKEGIEITMMTFDTEDPRSCGIVETNEQGIVFAFHEKKINPPGHQANAAVYIMEPIIIDFLLSLNKEEIDISTELLPKFLGRIQVYHNDLYHRDIGNLESLNKANIDFSKI